jgi:hypothetical protein
MPEFDIIQKAKHYNNHPSGVECGEISWQMTAALCQAFQYGWRYHEKADPAQDLRKMLFYVNKERQAPMHFLVGCREYRDHFREIMATRQHVFKRPSPWCESVRHAMAAICDYHCTAHPDERDRLLHKAAQCLEVAIEDEECLNYGRGIEP